MSGRHGYDVRVKLEGLVSDMPRDSRAAVEARRERSMGLAYAIHTMPVYGDSNDPFDHIPTGEWDAEWHLWVEAWTADSAHDKAMLRIQQDSSYVPGMFEAAARVTFTVDRMGM